MPMFLYHVTDEISAQKILKEGLVPQTGERSRLAGVDTPGIYLTSLSSLPYWKTILGRTVVLRIRMRKIKRMCRERKFADLYEEYTYDKNIPPTEIKLVRNKSKLSPSKRRKLAISYIPGIVTAHSLFMEYIKTGEEKDKNRFSLHMEMLRFVLPKLDYSGFTSEEFSIFLCSFYTHKCPFCCSKEMDKYKDYLASWRLLDTHELANSQSKWLFAWIKEKFPEVFI